MAELLRVLSKVVYDNRNHDQDKKKSEINANRQKCVDVSLMYCVKNVAIQAYTHHTVVRASAA